MNTVNARMEVHHGPDGIRPAGYQWANNLEEKAAKRSMQGYKARMPRDTDVTQFQKIVEFITRKG